MRELHWFQWAPVLFVGVCLWTVVGGVTVRVVGAEDDEAPWIAVGWPVVWVLLAGVGAVCGAWWLLTRLCTHSHPVKIVKALYLLSSGKKKWRDL